MRRTTAFLVSVILCLSMLAGCSQQKLPPTATAAVVPVYALVAKEIENPYMKKMGEGFKAACRELGVEAIYTGPDSPTPEKQIEVIREMIKRKVAVIAVAADDVDALEPCLKDAMAQGIKVISLDSAVNKDSRIVHIEQADPEMIGRVLIQAAAKMIGGRGKMAIMSATAQATNQNLWIAWMQKELMENPEKYKNIELLPVTYGDDLADKSTAVAKKLIKDNPDLKIIIAPTVVGMLAAGTVIQQEKSPVLLTGLGLPSEMAPFIKAGICPWMYLWNPSDIGYLAAYSASALMDGTITGKKYDTFTAGKLGLKVIISAADGGTEIMLGDPFKFDIDNIDAWKDVY